jgi:beta-lactamase regulating signal transducer with metallopeptidase domain
MANAVEAPRRTSVDSTNFAMWFCLVAFGSGGVRFSLSLLFVARTKRLGTAVDDPLLLAEVGQLAAQMKCSRTPVVRQLDHMNSAAVVGLLRPILVLPADWSHDELRASSCARIGSCGSIRCSMACCRLQHSGDPFL